jgi:methylenetetrahydrofolate dehydrogenase (NADP+)/methenyltetrahydrofolate cyclohydrolase
MRALCFRERRRVPAELIDGRQLAGQVKGDVRRTIAAAIASGRQRLGFAVVRVGNHPASAVYVRGKRRACEEIGIVSLAHDLPARTPESELLALIDELNGDPRVDGILGCCSPARLRPSVTASPPTCAST